MKEGITACVRVWSGYVCVCVKHGALEELEREREG